MSEFGAVITTLGLQRLAEAQVSGVPLVLTVMRVGDGGGSVVEPDPSFTGMVNTVYSVPVNQVYSLPSAPTQFRVEGVIPSSAGGWTTREAGAFNAADELILYAKTPETPKPDPASGAVLEELIRLSFTYANTTAVAITVDPAVIMASREYVNNVETVLNAKINPSLWSNFT